MYDPNYEVFSTLKTSNSKIVKVVDGNINIWKDKLLNPQEVTFLYNLEDNNLYYYKYDNNQIFKGSKVWGVPLLKGQNSYCNIYNVLYIGGIDGTYEFNVKSVKDDLKGYNLGKIPQKSQDTKQYKKLYTPAFILKLKKIKLKEIENNKLKDGKKIEQDKIFLVENNTSDTSDTSDTGDTGDCDNIIEILERFLPL